MKANTAIRSTRSRLRLRSFLEDAQVPLLAFPAGRSLAGAAARGAAEAGTATTLTQTSTAGSAPSAAAAHTAPTGITDPAATSPKSTPPTPTGSAAGTSRAGTASLGARDPPTPTTAPAAGVNSATPRGGETDPDTGITSVKPPNSGSPQQVLGVTTRPSRSSSGSGAARSGPELTPDSAPDAAPSAPREFAPGAQPRGLPTDTPAADPDEQPRQPNPARTRTGPGETPDNPPTHPQQLPPNLRQRQSDEQPGLSDYTELHSVRAPTMKSLLDHPPAPQVLESALDDLARNGPQSLIDRYTDAPKRTPLPLNDEQQAVTNPLIAGLAQARRDVPGFEVQPILDTGRPEDNPNTQPYLDNLLATGYRDQQAVTGIAERLATGGDGRAFERPSRKDPERAKQKIDTDYDGNASRLLDIAAARVEFDTVDQVYGALGRLTREPGVQIVRFKDRLADKPQDSGYGDLLLNLRLPDGHVGELRLQLGSMQRVDDFEHSLYEVRRDIEASAKAEGRPRTAREDAIIKELERRSNEFYQRALEKGTR